MLSRLEALNIGWTNMSKETLEYLVTSLPPSLARLNLAGCRNVLEDQGRKLDVHATTIQLL